MNLSKNKIEIKNFALPEIEQFIANFDAPKFRAKQLYNWLYKNFAVNFSEMQNLPKVLLSKLEKAVSLTTLNPETSSNSNATKTVKYLFSTKDNKAIESVVIPESKRITLCLSTQVGCPLDCKFCATGLMGFSRNLTVGEIVDQYLLTSRMYADKITNIVYMGMGEPLLNFDNVLKSLNIFLDENAVALGRNRITISTSGIPTKIRELAESKYRVKLALSLHSCFDETRSRIMPINKKYPLKEVIKSLEYYYRNTKNPLTYEYIMLKGLNDSEKDIKAITKLTRRFPSKLNVIPFNSIEHMLPEGYSTKLVPTERDEITKFVKKLKQNGVTVMIRDTQGDDIAAACGQLAIKNN